MTDLYAPAQPSGPAMFPPPGGVPARPKRPWSRTRIAASATAVFVAGGGLIGLLATSSTDTSTPRGVVEAYIGAAQDGNYTMAYGLLCDDYRNDYSSVRDYAEQSSSSDGFSQGISAKVTAVHYEGGGDYSVTTELSRFGARYEVDFRVVREHQAYRVCGGNVSGD